MPPSKHSAYKQALRTGVGLWIYGSIGGGERGHLLAVPKDALNLVMECVEAEAKANAHRLKSYSAELMRGADALLRSDELDDESLLMLAVTLIALHGPAGRIAWLVRNARKRAGTIEIDRDANVVRYSSMPVAEALLWATADPVTRH